jgi:sucrose-6-phosphate hydrolase SacC (GH32 family)
MYTVKKINKINKLLNSKKNIANIEELAINNKYYNNNNINFKININNNFSLYLFNNNSRLFININNNKISGYYNIGGEIEFNINSYKSLIIYLKLINKAYTTK